MRKTCYCRCLWDFNEYRFTLKHFFNLYNISGFLKNSSRCKTVHEESKVQLFTNMQNKKSLTENKNKCLKQSKESFWCFFSWQAVGFVWGYYIQQFGATIIIVAAGFIVSCIVSNGTLKFVFNLTLINIRIIFYTPPTSQCANSNRSSQTQNFQTQSQGQVVRKPVNNNPGLKVNQNIFFSWQMY